MKKIKNMNFQEAKEAFSKWEAKHPRLDDFDMGGLTLTQCREITSGADPEAIATMLYDLFNYGFMAGYKQSEADLKARVDKRIHDDMHRRLLELVYHLPFGYHAEYFYYFMVYSFEDDDILKAFFPGRIAKPALEIRAEHEAKEAREKAEREERKKVVDEALKQYERQKGGVSA